VAYYGKSIVVGFYIDIVTRIYPIFPMYDYIVDLIWTQIWVSSIFYTNRSIVLVKFLARVLTVHDS